MASTIAELLRRRMTGGGAIAPITIDATMGKYIYTDGSLRNNNGWYYTTLINVSAGDVVVFQAYGGASNAVIAKYNEGANYTMLVKGTSSSSYLTYTYTMTENCQIALSAKKGAIDAVATVNGNNVTINYIE